MTGSRVEETKRVVGKQNFESNQAGKQSDPFAALYNGSAWDFAKNTANFVQNATAGGGVTNPTSNGAMGFEA